MVRNSQGGRLIRHRHFNRTHACPAWRGLLDLLFLRHLTNVVKGIHGVCIVALILRDCGGGRCGGRRPEKPVAYDIQYLHPTDIALRRPWARNGADKPARMLSPVSYTHLTLPTIYSV